jgi:hypothetical protein
LYFSDPTRASHSGNGVKLTLAQLMQLITELGIRMPTESAVGGKKPLKEDYCRTILEHLFLIQHLFNIVHSR